VEYARQTLQCSISFLDRSCTLGSCAMEYLHNSSAKLAIKSAKRIVVSVMPKALAVWILLIAISTSIAIHSSRLVNQSWKKVKLASLRTLARRTLSANSTWSHQIKVFVRSSSLFLRIPFSMHGQRRISFYVRMAMAYLSLLAQDRLLTRLSSSLDFINAAPKMGLKV